MKVLDIATQNILESENEFITEQWRKLPGRFHVYKEPEADEQRPDAEQKAGGQQAEKETKRSERKKNEQLPEGAP